ncbi:SDR family oxidoreductase [Salisaeta longa]|uniref:SDR family oxidoreductase n=1 Tax=Salisaeta longa TaxID=503170 RepID=UPI0003B502D9|nr:SDR family oxidoreductase [Salisaeta longa]
MDDATLRDLTGHVCVVTGANSGIGKETARALARQGAEVAMVCRSPERGAAARDELAAAVDTGHFSLFVADLAVQEDVRAVAAELSAHYDRIDVLVNNAGVLRTSRETTPDGIEYTLAVNYLAPFLLTHLLLDDLEATAQAHGEARVVNVGSDAQRAATLDLDDLQNEDDYSGMQAYAQSKLALTMFTHELAHRMYETGVAVNCVHPGVVNTNIWRDQGWLPWLARRFRWLFRSPAGGAKGVVYLAAAEEAKGVTGQYFRETEEVKPPPAAFDEKKAARLWGASLALTDLESTVPVYQKEAVRRAT